MQCRLDRPLCSSLFMVHSVTCSFGSDGEASVTAVREASRISYSNTTEHQIQELTQLCLKEHRTGVCPVVFKKTRVFIDVYAFNTSEGRHSGWICAESQTFKFFGFLNKEIF